jgi:hypothetical protein
MKFSTGDINVYELWRKLNVAFSPKFLYLIWVKFGVGFKKNVPNYIWKSA